MNDGETNVLQRTKNAWENLSRAQRIIFSLLIVFLFVLSGFWFANYNMQIELSKQTVARQAAEEALQAELNRPVPEDSRIASLKDQLRIAQKTAEEERHEAYKQEEKLRARNNDILTQANTSLAFLRTLTDPTEVAGVLYGLRPVMKQSGVGDSSGRGGGLYMAYADLLEQIGKKLGFNVFSRPVLNAANGIVLGGDAFVLRMLWGNDSVRAAAMVVARDNKQALALFSKYPELLSVGLPEEDASEWNEILYGYGAKDEKKTLSFLGLTAKDVTPDEVVEMRYYLGYFARRTGDSSPLAVTTLRKILAEIVGELFPAKKVAAVSAASKPVVAVDPKSAKSDVAKLVPATTDAPVVDCRWDQFRIGDGCIDTKPKE